MRQLLTRADPVSTGLLANRGALDCLRAGGSLSFPRAISKLLGVEIGRSAFLFLDMEAQKEAQTFVSPHHRWLKYREQPNCICFAHSYPQHCSVQLRFSALESLRGSVLFEERYTDCFNVLASNMRILKTDTIELILLHEGTPPKYAILSHTWGEDEVVFEDFSIGNPKNKSAYAKVQAACQQAANDGYEYIWIDNCCIDKSSSAELSEAINSMYLWYAEAGICYAYLADVDALGLNPQLQSMEFRYCLSRSRWFTRGWTLQELLAPREMVFFSKDWTVIGTKSELRTVLSDVTGIDESILERPSKLYSASIAKRMSWAADRRTTRAEDLAYCLMGVFSVNMPMLYGEGFLKAYLRLQEEIMKQSDDQSLFAWTDNLNTSDRHGLLADHPSAFRSSSKVIPYEDYAPRPPFQMTNRGLSLELPLSRLNDDIWIAALDCPVPPLYPDSSFLAIYLKKLSPNSDHYTRTHLGRLTQLNELGARQTIYVRQIPPNFLENERFLPRHIFQLRSIPFSTKDSGRRDPDEIYDIVDLVYSPDEKSKTGPPRLTTSRAIIQGRLLPTPSTFSIAKGANQLAVAIVFKHIISNDQVVVMLGSSGDFRVGHGAAIGSYMQGVDMTYETLSSVYRAADAGLDGNYSGFHKATILTIPGLTKLSFYEHEVRIKMDSVVSGASKYFMVDLEIVVKQIPSTSTNAPRGSLSEEEQDMSKGIIPTKKSFWKRVGALKKDT